MKQMQKQGNGTTNEETFVQQRKLSTKRKGYLQNGRRYLQMIHSIRGCDPKYNKKTHTTLVQENKQPD